MTQLDTNSTNLFQLTHQNERVQSESYQVIIKKDLISTHIAFQIS